MKKANLRGKLTAEGYTFSSGELEWARENLASLRRTAQDDTALYLIMGITFVLGLAAYFVADAIASQTIRLPEGWRPGLITDLLNSLGVTLWTSVILVFFLEVVVESQRRRWRKYVQLVERVLGEQGLEVSSERQNDQSGREIRARLDEIVRRLKVIELALRPQDERPKEADK